MTLKTYKLGDLVERSTVNNKEQKYGMDLIEGVNTQGVFAPPKGNPIEVNLKPYKIVKDGAFVYNPTRLELGSIAYRTNGLCIVSHLYQVFYLNEKGKKLIDPTYLFIYFRRKEFCREVTFRNFGSQRPHPRVRRRNKSVGRRFLLRKPRRLHCRGGFQRLGKKRLDVAHSRA